MSAIDVAAMLFLGAVWGGSYLFIRVAVPDLGPLPLAAARVAVASVILVLVPSIRRDLPLLRKRAGALLLLGATNAAIPYALIAAAEIRVTASLAAILGATIPLCTSVWAAVSLGQRITPRQAAGLALGLAGVVALVGWSPMPLTPVTILAVAAILAASVSYGYANVYIKRRLSGVPPRALALGQQLGGFAWLVVPAAVVAPTVHPTATSAAALLALATLSTAVAYLVYFRLIARVGPTRTSMVAYLIPVFAAAWGTLFLHERLTLGMLGATGCVLAGVGLANGGGKSVGAASRRPIADAG